MKLLVIIASTRPGRIGPTIADWFVGQATEHGGFDVEVADLAEIDLPLLDEPAHPATGKYVHQHTKDWSALVDSADAFVFVMPEYNHSYTAPLKNAIDYLNREWAYKPVGFVSYGGVSGGLRAVQAIKPVIERPADDRRSSTPSPSRWCARWSTTTASTRPTSSRARPRSCWTSWSRSAGRWPGARRGLRPSPAIGSAQSYHSHRGVAVARVVVDVVLKPEILDPQGQAIVGALGRLGIDGVRDVRQGKHFELEVDDDLDDDDRRRGSPTRCSPTR